jgi:hypothetical protein
MSGNDQLLVDLGALKQLGAELITASNSLGGLEDMTAELALEVGHTGLSQHMSEFSKSWGHRREDLVGNVRALADQVYGVVSELMRTDSTLAKSLTDGQAPT